MRKPRFAFTIKCLKGKLPTFKRVQEDFGMVFEVVRKSPICFPSKRPRIRISIPDTSLNGLYQYRQMSFQGLRLPGVQQLIEELAAMPSNVS